MLGNDCVWKWTTNESSYINSIFKIPIKYSNYHVVTKRYLVQTGFLVLTKHQPSFWPWLSCLPLSISHLWSDFLFMKVIRSLMFILLYICIHPCFFKVHISSFKVRIVACPIPFFVSMNYYVCVICLYMFFKWPLCRFLDYLTKWHYLIALNSTNYINTWKKQITLTISLSLALSLFFL